MVSTGVTFSGAPRRPVWYVTRGGVTEAAATCKVEHRHECRETLEEALLRLRRVYATDGSAARELSTGATCHRYKRTRHSHRLSRQGQPHEGKGRRAGRPSRPTPL